MATCSQDPISMNFDLICTGEYVNSSCFTLKMFGPIHYEHQDPGEDAELMVCFGIGTTGKSHRWHHLLLSDKAANVLFFSYLRTGQ